ncbi:MAG: DUF1554 domain-containing protein [archaeon]|nr:DUF1554 domain-containing protein [archaeon]
MKSRFLRGKVLILLIFIILFSIVIITITLSIPTPPGSSGVPGFLFLKGNVQVNNEIVPEKTNIIFYINGTKVANTTTNIQGDYSIVIQEYPQYSGMPINTTVNGCKTQQKINYNINNQNSYLDLTVSTNEANCNFNFQRNYLFVTSSSYDGNLGGIAGADEKCNSDINKPTNHPGNYKALISTNGSFPIFSEINSLLNIYSAHTVKKIADNYTDLTEGNIYNTITEDESCFTKELMVWTGAEEGMTCNSWTKNTGWGNIGFSCSEYYFWSGPGITSCNEKLKLYCIGPFTNTEYCGDGILSGIENCDNGNLNTNTPCSTIYEGNCTYCDNKCKTHIIIGNYCGNNVCDSGEDSINCNTDCSPTCGNGVLESSEQCDNGNLNTNVPCSATGNNCTYCDNSCKTHTVQNNSQIQYSWKFIQEDGNPTTNCNWGINNFTCNSNSVNKIGWSDNHLENNGYWSNLYWMSNVKCQPWNSLINTNIIVYKYQCVALYCGDEIISSGETYKNCPIDYGICGDNICNNGETCSSCSSDCGTCSTLPGNNGGSSGGSSSGGSSGGGGGGDSSATITNPGTNSITTTANEYTVTNEQMTNGYTQTLSSNQQVNFQILDNTQHTLTVNSIGSNYAEITIQSEPIKLKLNVGEEKKLNLNSLDHYDLYVKLENISNNKANITIKTINEPIKKEGNISTITGNVVGFVSTKNGKKTIVVAIVLIAIMVIFLLNKKRSKKLKKDENSI